MSDFGRNTIENADFHLPEKYFALQSATKTKAIGTSALAVILKESGICMKKTMFGLFFALIAYQGIAPAQAQNISLGGNRSCQLIINGINEGGCVNSITQPYTFGSDTYIFGVSYSDGTPWYYDYNSQTWTQISSQTALSSIQSAALSFNGQVYLNVTGQGGTSFVVNVNLFVGGVNTPPVIPPTNPNRCSTHATITQYFYGTTSMSVLEQCMSQQCQQYMTCNSTGNSCQTHESTERSFTGPDQRFVIVSCIASAGSNSGCQQNVVCQ